MGNIAASVLLKLFINGNNRCQTTDAPLEHERNSIFKCKQHTIHDPWWTKKSLHNDVVWGDIKTTTNNLCHLHIPCAIKVFIVTSEQFTINSDTFRFNSQPQSAISVNVFWNAWNSTQFVCRQGLDVYFIHFLHSAQTAQIKNMLLDVMCGFKSTLESNQTCLHNICTKFFSDFAVHEFLTRKKWR